MNDNVKKRLQEFSAENTKKLRQLYKFLMYNDLIENKSDLVRIVEDSGESITLQSFRKKLDPGSTERTRAKHLKPIEKWAKKKGVNIKEVYESENLIENYKNEVQQLKLQLQELEESNTRLVMKIERIKIPVPEDIGKYYSNLFEIGKDNIDPENIEYMQRVVSKLSVTLKIIQASYDLAKAKEEM